MNQSRNYKKNQKNFEPIDNENTICQNLWYTAKIKLTGKFIVCVSILKRKKGLKSMIYVSTLKI